MFILGRKLALHGAGYRNLDPFTAGSMGQVAPALQANQMAPQQQATPAAPNTVVPSTEQPQDPNLGTSFAAGTGSQPTVDGGSSPLDQIMQQIYTKPEGQNAGGDGQPQATTPQQKALDLMNLPMQEIQKVAQGMDFTKGISEDTMAKFQINPETNQPTDLLGGIMELMQHVGGNVYTNSMLGGGKMAGTALDQRFTDLNSQLPNMVNRQQVASTMQAGDYHQALQPVVSNAVNQMLANNPQTTPEQAKAMADQLVQALGAHLAPAQEDPTAPQAGTAGSTIFDF